MAKRGKPTGNKRQRERDKQRKREDKDARRKWRKDMRARGLDPDVVDEEGRPLVKPEDDGLGTLENRDEETSERPADAGADAPD